MATLRQFPPKQFAALLQAVPTVSTPASLLDTFLSQAWLVNTNNSAQTITLTNGAGTQAIPAISIPANTAQLINWPDLLFFGGGIKWLAGGTGVNAELFGFIIGA